MRIFLIVVSLVCLSCSALAGAAAFEFPDLDLSSSPAMVRAWVKQHEFRTAVPTEADQEMYQRDYGDSRREKVGFVALGQGLSLLQFEQTGLPDGAATLRRKVYRQFGKPEKDQILGDGTLRLIYSYKYREPARRVFLVQPHVVSMFLMTDAYVNRVNSAPAENGQAGPVKQKSLAREAPDGHGSWFIPVLWIAGVLLAPVALVKVAPPAVGDPVKRLLRSALDGLFGVTQEALTYVFYLITTFMLYAMALLSTMGVGAGALEWGTSWWWGVPLIFGVVMTHRANDDDHDYIKWAYVAIAFYAIALGGVFIQGK